MNSRRGIAAFANRVACAVVSLVACAILCIVVGGCAGGQVTSLRDAAQVKQVIARSDQPVLVDFYKGGCPTCIPVDGMMDKLTEEYKGRVIIAKFMLMQPYGVATSPELEKKYDIRYYPMVILFVNGRETWRFLRDYNLDDYRKAMNGALGVATTQRGLSPQPK